MSTSKQAFTQVKNILRKLDASIDEARAKRLGVDHGAIKGSSISGARSGGSPHDPGLADDAMRRRARPTPPSENTRNDVFGAHLG